MRKIRYEQQKGKRPPQTPTYRRNKVKQIGTKVPGIWVVKMEKKKGNGRKDTRRARLAAKWVYAGITKDTKEKRNVNDLQVVGYHPDSSFHAARRYRSLSFEYCLSMDG